MQDLLVHITIDEKFPNPSCLCSLLNSEVQLLAVSDGSCKHSAMSYGWVLSLQGQPFASGFGPCYGNGNSFRSEAFGMLSVSLFVSVLQQYRGTPCSPLRVHFACDNLELVRREHRHTTYSDPYPNTTLTPEFDVTEQIFLIHRQFNIEAQFSHVKGHQDASTAYQDLPLIAQRNVDADSLATRGINLYPDPQSPIRVPMLPSCSAILNLNGDDITRNYRHALIKTATEPPYMRKLQTKFEWSDSVIQQIAWQCLTLATKRISRRVLLTKCCNDLLPTGTVLHRHKQQSHDKCPHCGQSETHEHLFLCSKNPARFCGRQKYLKQVRTRLPRLGVPGSIVNVFSSCVAEWFDTSKVDIQKYDSRYHSAIRSQSDIGWRHIFMGHLSQEWLNLTASLQ